MHTEENIAIKKIGEGLGYLFSYFTFTTILYFVVYYLEKIPETWTYFHVMLITLIIAYIGFVISWLLKK